MPMKAEPFVHACIRLGGVRDDDVNLCDTCRRVDTCERHKKMNRGQGNLWDQRVGFIAECSDYEEGKP
jgi:hypothetical protein